MSVSDFPYPGNDTARPRALPPALARVSLWWCLLEATDPALSMLAAWLSDAERARAARFGTKALARRYSIGRAALRWVLARQLDVEPGRVPIERGSRGRPRVANGAGIDFNVSHTRGVALIGVVASEGHRIGVDVEHGDRALNHVGLARKYLTSREQASIEAEDVDLHRRAFLRLWTCKEAMAKATGDALAAPMRKLDVELAPVVRLVDGPAPYLPADWTLAAATVPEGYIGSVALWRRLHPRRDAV